MRHINHNYEFEPIDLLNINPSPQPNFWPFCGLKLQRSRTSLPDTSGEYVATLHDGSMLTLTYDHVLSRWWSRSTYYGQGTYIGLGGSQHLTLKAWFKEPPRENNTVVVFYLSPKTKTDTAWLSSNMVCKLEPLMEPDSA